MQGYRLSKEAQDDLKEIKNYSRMTWGNKQTQEYLSEIKNSLEKLIISPELGKIRDEIIDGLRSFGVGRHIIFYRLGKTEIEVARILHKRMDVTRHFDGF
jgi:toxin ParE1/3/4